MDHKLKHKIAWWLLLSDIIGIILAFNITHLIRFGNIVPSFTSWDLLWMLICIIGALYIFDLYKLDIKLLGLNQYFRVIIAVSIASVIIITIGYVTTSFINGGPSGLLSRLVLIASIALFSLWGILWRFYLTRHYAQYIPNWVIVGLNDSTKQFIEEYKKQKIRGNLFFLSSPDSNSQGENFNISGSIEDIDKIIHTEKPAGIIIGKDIDLSNEIQNKLMNIHLKGTKVYNLITFYEQFWSKIPVLHLDNTWFMISSDFYILHNPIGMRIKRLMDIIVSLILLILTSPLILITALGIKLTSKGRIFFTQERVGLNGDIFMLYKFRTMYEGSEKGDKYTDKNDNRITRIGKFLRLTRIDELPQLFNVLKGEMSFIGPRAEWTRCVADYEDAIPYYRLRHLVKPGITGWAQVNYPYGASIEDTREKLEYDLYYIKNYSIWLDVWILAKTVKVVLFGKGR